ncbi:MAG: hypothetical protein HYR60_31780, partial [Acidobacteria bacterium]|nr:hypothetical protein [Acidobacteriota bacterium]
MRILTLSVLIASLGRPEIVDRVAVRVGNAVIAESDILREIRLAAFLNGEPPDFGPGARRQTAERLVDQRLIRKEIETGRYPEPEPSGVEAVLKEALTSRRDLSAYRISEDDLKAHLTWQLTALRF